MSNDRIGLPGMKMPVTHFVSPVVGAPGPLQGFAIAAVAVADKATPSKTGEIVPQILAITDRPDVCAPPPERPVPLRTTDIKTPPYAERSLGSVNRRYATDHTSPRSMRTVIGRLADGRHGTHASTQRLPEESPGRVARRRFLVGFSLETKTNDKLPPQEFIHSVPNTLLRNWFLCEMAKS